MILLELTGISMIDLYFAVHPTFRENITFATDIELSTGLSLIPAPSSPWLGVICPIHAGRMWSASAY
jgi:hypothetical protein